MLKRFAKSKPDRLQDRKISKKDNKLYGKWKCYGDLFNRRIGKEDIIISNE